MTHISAQTNDKQFELKIMRFETMGEGAGVMDLIGVLERGLKYLSIPGNDFDSSCA